MAPLGAAKAWLEADRQGLLAAYLTAEDKQWIINALVKQGRMRSPLLWYQRECRTLCYILRHADRTDPQSPSRACSPRTTKVGYTTVHARISDLSLQPCRRRPMLSRSRCSSALRPRTTSTLRTCRSRPRGACACSAASRRATPTTGSCGPTRSRSIRTCSRGWRSCRRTPSGEPRTILSTAVTHVNIHSYKKYKVGFLFDVSASCVSRLEMPEDVRRPSA
jgi:hypothetical protein